MRSTGNRLKKLLSASFFSEAIRGLKTVLERFAGKSQPSARTGSNGEIKDIKQFPLDAKITAAKIFTPVIRTDEIHSIGRIDERSGFQADSVQWQSNGTSREEIHHKRMVVTSSNAVRRIDDIKVKCSDPECGGFDTVQFICHVCRAKFCEAHIHPHTLQNQTVSIWLCREHYQLALEHFDLWEDYDNE
jgi:hypothetical protein